MTLFYFHAVKADCNLDVLLKYHINGAYLNKERNNLVKSLKIMLRGFILIPPKHNVVECRFKKARAISELV